MRGHHPGQCRGHFRPQRDVAIALVPKGIQLLDDLVAAFLGVQLQGFERRPIVLLEGIARGNAPPRGEDVIAERQVFRVEIAEAGERFPLHHNNLAHRREAGQAGERIADGVKRARHEHRRRALLHIT